MCPKLGIRCACRVIHNVLPSRFFMHASTILGFSIIYFWKVLSRTVYVWTASNSLTYAKPLFVWCWNTWGHIPWGCLAFPKALSALFTFPESLTYSICIYWRPYDSQEPLDRPLWLCRHLKGTPPNTVKLQECFFTIFYDADTHTQYTAVTSTIGEKAYWGIPLADMWPHAPYGTPRWCILLMS